MALDFYFFIGTDVFEWTDIKIGINGMHYKFKNIRMRKNVGSNHSNQVAWQRSAVAELDGGGCPGPREPGGP